MGDKRCMGCMERFPDKLKMCPFCGYVVDTPAENAVHMEPGTLLANRYIVGKVLGYGGFGVTYLGYDGRLQQKVAIKEYFPTEFSTRMPGKTMLTVSNDMKKREQFESGLVKFIEEAKRLAKFQNTPGVVKIFDAFKENDTAYIIMEYLDGETLTNLLERVGTINEDQAINMLMPVMRSLEVVHKQGIIHRDIAPDNIFITKDGNVKLIDFGASRYATTTHSRSITVIIKPGYSPEEQYRSRGDQGPHTDVYAIAATLYRMITGEVPPDALERRSSCETKRRDTIKPPHILNRKISKNVENALLNALNVRIEDRTPDIESFINELQADPPVKRRYGNIKKIDLYHWPLWVKIAIPLIAVLIVVVGIAAISSIVHVAPPDEAVVPDGMVVVPYVEGEKMSDATEMIKNSSLNVTVAGNIESNYIEAERIVLQDPLGGTYQDRFGIVNIWVSSGENIPEVVPLLVGKTEEEAINKLREAGFENIRKSGEEYSDLYDEGLIKSQYPEYSGEKVPLDTEITYVISLGPEPFEMPSVIGKTKQEAEEILKDTGLIIRYSEVEGDEKDVGKIKEQSKKAGDVVKKGDEVYLSVITKKPTIAVEDVVGLDKAEAESILKAQGFKVNSSAEEYSDEPKGKVTKQSPAAGTSHSEGTTVTIVISKGPQETSIITPPVEESEPQTDTKITVDNVVGKKQNIAEATLSNQGFTVKVEKVFSDEIAADYVISQSPSAGSSLTKGSTITITVSKGTQKFSVPNVIGKSQSAAKSELESKGFKVTVNSSYNNSIAKDIVFSQSPNSSDMKEKGDTVRIFVSQGPAPKKTVKVPRVVNLSRSNAVAELENSGLKVKVEEQNNDKVTKGYVISQSPAAESIVDKDSEVKIIVSKGKKTITVTLDPNGGTLSESSTKKVYLNENYGNLSTPTRKNYEFTGWYTSSSGGTKVTSSTVVSTSANHTLYAHWKRKITITYDTNGGTISESSNKTVYKNEKYGTLPTPTRDYYTFVGWYTSKTGGTQITSSTIVSNSSNHNLYAHWTKKGTKSTGWITESEANNLGIRQSDIINIETKWIYTEHYFGWVETNRYERQYVDFPDGYDRNHSTYNSYEKSRDYSNSEGTYVVTDPERIGWIYWHWMYNCGGANAYDRGVWNQSGTEPTTTYVYQYFRAYRIDTDYSMVDSSGGYGYRNRYCGVPVYYMNDDKSYDFSAGSYYWFRLPVYKQTCYTREWKETSSEQKEIISDNKPSGDNITVEEKMVQIKYYYD